MDQLEAFFKHLFESTQFMPRWVCGQWSPLHGWLYIVSDIIIFLAYMAIPLAMVYFVRKRWGDLPFRGVFWLFIAFISLCGMTHLVDAIIFWVPYYRFNALLLAVTATVSVVTVAAMVKVLPQALAYKSPLELQVAVDSKTAELEKRIAELNVLHERISRKKEQVENFAYIASHNLRSPAANLISLIRHMDVTDSEEERQEILPMMMRSGELLLQTLDDVSQVLMQSNPMLPAYDIRFDEMTEEIAVDLDAEIKEQNATIERHFEACPTIFYAPDHLKNVMFNLISNAIRYRHPYRDPVVSLRTWSDANESYLECKDNGRGIDLQKYGHDLFKLYKTFDGVPDAKGLGLFLVKHQLESLNGSVFVESTLGQGTTFTVRFGNMNELSQ